MSTPVINASAGLTPQMAIVGLGGAPTPFFFRWLLNTRSAATQTPWTSDIDAAGFGLSNLGALSLDGPITFPDGTVQTTAYIPGSGGGSVSSVFGRSGVVTAQAGDYNVSQVTGAAAAATVINAGVGLSGGGDLSADRTLALVPATASALGGVKIGSGITVSADGTISAAAGGGSQTPWTSDINAAGHNLLNAATIAGQGSLLLTSAASGNITANSAGNIALQATGSAQILTGGTPRITVTAAGRVGIGTISPGYPLDVAGDVNISGVYRVNGVPLNTGSNQTPWTSNIDAAGFQLLNVPIVAGNPNLTIGSNGAGLLNLNTNLKSRLYIDSPGHVQIATPDDNGVRLWFTADVGPKIGLYGSNTVNNFGIGLGSGALQLYTHSSPYKISIGYGSGGDTAFTEWANFNSGGLNFTGNVAITSAAGLSLVAVNMAFATNSKNRITIDAGGTAHLYANDSGNAFLYLNDASYIYSVASNNSTVVFSAASLALYAGGSNSLTLNTNNKSRFGVDGAGVAYLYGQDANSASTLMLMADNTANSYLLCDSTLTTSLAGKGGIQLRTGSQSTRLLIGSTGIVTAGNTDNGYGVVYFGLSSRAYIQANDATGDMVVLSNSTINIWAGGSARIGISSGGAIVVNAAASASVNTLVVNGTSYFKYAESDYFTSNAYFNGSQWIYRTTAAAGVFNVSGGSVYIQSAASGTPGAAASFFANIFMNPNVTILQKALQVDPGFMGLDSQLAAGNFYFCLGGTPQGSALIIRARDINGTLRNYTLPLA